MKTIYLVLSVQLNGLTPEIKIISAFTSLKYVNEYVIKDQPWLVCKEVMLHEEE